MAENQQQEAPLSLSRRERQIMEILFRRGRATAAEVHADLADRPSYSAVRAHLRTLEEKGHVHHQEENLRYVYLPALAPEKARRSALEHTVHTFFGGSPARLVAALLDRKASKLSKDEIREIERLIDRAKKEGR